MRQQLGDEVGNFDKYACGGVKSWLQERGRVSFLGACFDERKVSREQPARGQNYWLSEDCKTMEQKSEKNLDGHTGCFFGIGALVFEKVLSCETRGPILRNRGPIQRNTVSLNRTGHL